MKKKYNPFKMWGSWVGGIIGAFLTEIIPNTCLGGQCNFINTILSSYTTAIPFGFVVGFLIGWGIHSLVRKLK